MSIYSFHKHSECVVIFCFRIYIICYFKWVYNFTIISFNKPRRSIFTYSFPFKFHSTLQIYSCFFMCNLIKITSLIIVIYFISIKISFTN
jgi:hypothetical protein